ncbi:MAG: hypothetical protein WBB45_07825 [Cyclobacteriaceae bacterium]
MAKITEKSPYYGLSGKVGNFVIRTRRNGTSFLAMRPGKGTAERSEKQKENSGRFGDAAEYASRELRRMEGQLYYEAHKKGAQSSYHAAVRDFMSGPMIDHVDIVQENDKLRIVAEITDDTLVVACIVSYEHEGETVFLAPEVMEGWDMYQWETEHTEVEELTIHSIDRATNVSEVVVKVKERSIEELVYLN